MKTKLMFVLTLLLAMALVLSACGGGTPATEQPAPEEPGAPTE